MAHLGGESLHFDLREKVRLDRASAPIQVVTSMELKPDIQVNQDAEQIAIKGHLLLKGEYVGAAGEQREQHSGLELEPFHYKNLEDAALALIEHRIPVDILVPLKKVEQTAEIEAAVTAFDFTLISPYELEIAANMEIFGLRMANTGKAPTDDKVASSVGGEDIPYTGKAPDKAGYGTVLAGYQPERPKAQPAEETDVRPAEDQDERKREPEDENVFVFRALAGMPDDPGQEKPGEERAGNVIQLRPHDQTESAPEALPEENETVRAAANQAAGNGADEQKADSDETKQAGHAGSDGANHPQGEAETDGNNEASGSDGEGDQEEAGQDVKVAISGKSIHETEEPLRIASFLQHKLIKLHEATAEEEATEGEEAKTDPPAWKASGQTRRDEQFSSVKMRIVQKGETWESIADEYQMDVAAIIKANGNKSELLEEGQVLFIPSLRRR